MFTSNFAGFSTSLILSLLNSITSSSFIVFSIVFFNIFKLVGFDICCSSIGGGRWVLNIVVGVLLLVVGGFVRFITNFALKITEVPGQTHKDRRTHTQTNLKTPCLVMTSGYSFLTLEAFG